MKPTHCSLRGPRRPESCQRLSKRATPNFTLVCYTNILRPPTACLQSAGCILHPAISRSSYCSRPYRHIKCGEDGIIHPRDVIVALFLTDACRNFLRTSGAVKKAKRMIRLYLYVYPHPANTLLFKQRTHQREDVANVHLFLYTRPLFNRISHNLTSTSSLKPFLYPQQRSNKLLTVKEQTTHLCNKKRADLLLK